MRISTLRCKLFWVVVLSGVPALDAQTRAVPRAWDDQAMASLEVPLADPTGSPKHVPAAYYYRIPVRPIYRQYPVYAPGHEPPDYTEWLKQRKPEVVWGVDPETGATHAPPLKTEEDWIKAGELVFDATIYYTNHRIVDASAVTNPAWYRKTGTPVARDGTLPFARWVVRRKEQVDLGNFACGMCHTRVMNDGAILKGAQGNFPFERSKAAVFSGEAVPPPASAPKNAAQSLRVLRTVDRSLFAAPWLKPDPSDPIDTLSFDELVSAHAAIPAGVVGRHRVSLANPVQVPDLIGIKDRRYLDRTGLQQHRGIVDLMRYAALNQGADDLASYAGFIPADFPAFQKRPEPDDMDRVGGRYSDEQLYALALYLYSLKPPPNPSPKGPAARRGREVFEREGCSGCHTPPLYTNNKLTPAEGFTPPPGARGTYDILAIPVHTDSSLTLQTRRGTGYYKVPSLKGLWYRSMFGHSGWCATLEDWFDPRRTRDDYIPTGFKPYGPESYAVKGHPFGLGLSDDDRSALIVFLKTL